MKKRLINLTVICLAILFLFYLVGCSYKVKKTSTNKNFNEIIEEKGVSKEMLASLYNMGFTEQEIIKLPKEEMDRLFAPGTQLDGVGFEPTKEQIEELKKVGIDVQMSVVLYNLGYKYEDMKNLSSKEIDFIFPNTELIENLSKKGFNKDKISYMLNEGKTYKDIISDALN